MLENPVVNKENSYNSTALPAEMIIERDTGIEMDDGLTLRADIFRPKTENKVPAIMNLGPYNKGLPFQEGYAPEWERLIGGHPEIAKGSNCAYMTWETLDPERWVREGYAIVRIDSRGAGRSPGYLDLFSPREVRDYYIAIEWAASQKWCSGKIGLCGISYYAINEWLVASLQPPHLSAILPWEGASDHYRDMTHHGGILSNGFQESWYRRRLLPRQHGKGSNSARDPWLGEPAAGPETLSEEDLRTNRSDYLNDIREHKLDDEYHRARTPDFTKILVPLMSAGNWGGLGLHNRGNFEGFTRCGSSKKWLSVHPGRHEEYFYLPYGFNLQKRFFDFYLKEIDNGWEKEPPVLLTIRRINTFEERKEMEWPLARTRWTKLYLDCSSKTLSWSAPKLQGKISFEAFGESLTLFSEPLVDETEITGPISAKLYASSSTPDADIFLTFRAFSPEGEEIVFQGANEPRAPLSQGWLRASHRRLDQKLSTPYRPYHTHDGIAPLTPGEVYELDVEIWPTCIVVPRDYRIALTIGGRDFSRAEPVEPNKGSGPFLHNHPDDRGGEEFRGRTEIQSDEKRASFLILPLIPQI